MTDILECIGAIERGLQRLGRTALLRALQPGLDRGVVESVVRASGLPFEPALADLYGWRDGTRTDGEVLDDIQIFPGFYFMSLSDAISAHQVVAVDPRWQVGWLPLFANGGGDFYVIDLHGPLGAILHFRIEQSMHPMEFKCLTDMIATLAAAFDRGVFFVDDAGYLEMDDIVFGQLAGELNPEVSWWHA